MANPVAAAVVLIAAFFWAMGAISSRHAQTPVSPRVGTALQMLTGGVWLFLASRVTGELGSFHPASVSPLSLVAMVYLILLGQLVGFTSYMWLLRVTTPALVSTTSFVSIVIAVFLGWALVREPLTARTLAATFVILGGVILITLNQRAFPATGGNAPRAAATIEPQSQETAQPQSGSRSISSKALYK